LEDRGIDIKREMIKKGQIAPIQMTPILTPKFATIDI